MSDQQALQQAAQQARGPEAPAISIVIPCYRSADNLPDLHRRLDAVCAAKGLSAEFVLVEDGGGDGTWDVISQLARVDRRVVGIQLARNYGQHNALLCGIRAARGQVIVTMDDDLQNPPEEIPRLLSKIDEGFDVVYGSPVQENHGFLRNVASLITKLALQHSMGAETARKSSAFRAFRTRLRNAFADYNSPTVSIEVLLTWGTTRFSSVDVRQDRRERGQSGYTVRKLMTHALNMMTGFSTLPLQIASVVGLLFAAGGFLVLMYVLVRYFTSDAVVPGFSFLASIISIFSGVQLFSLGIIGEYIARMHFRSMERPPYSVRSSTEDTSPPQ